ncbi:prepilin peptidase CpaA [Paenibacillus methanolicus]|uniref:Prepilin peptidase CpaA n=2 Tax=Paenibacillus methanolicus TaxID=582686 RepID=A0A5S5BXA4_9BACL|nr:prepilin peptidase CpaA [Paenibacillus methanolicus]
MTITGTGAAIVLACAFATDMRAMRIPNLLTVIGFASGVICQLLTAGWHGGQIALVGALAGFLPFFLLYLFKGIGAGDVKLFAALGAWLGAAAVLNVAMYAILYAGALGLLYMLASRPFCRRMLGGMAVLLSPGAAGKREALHGWEAGAKRFPFMIAVLPAAISVWAMGS